ncbi:hypothetical protein GCM10025858_23360 [Alicyclobacillus sacchari]|nr:hypothetical protein GCM10025858_23360 [Alicyclobacillus sacchari]
MSLFKHLGWTEWRYGLPVKIRKAGRYPNDWDSKTKGVGDRLNGYMTITVDHIMYGMLTQDWKS